MTSASLAATARRARFEFRAVGPVALAGLCEQVAAAAAETASRGFLLYLLTPALAETEGFSGYVPVAAALGKASYASGWNVEKNHPRPIRTLIPAGSVYSFEWPKEAPPGPPRAELVRRLSASFALRRRSRRRFRPLPAGDLAMNLTIPAGHHLLRLTALTPANCGDTGGSAAIDRPVAVDAWAKLPYLPHSALKGVLAGRRGNVHRRGGGFEKDRTDLFGAPDIDDTNTGREGDLVFGDAETLAFPALLHGGRRALVAPAAALGRLARRGILPAGTLRHVGDERAWGGPVSRSELPQVSDRLVTARFGFDASVLSALLGFGGPVIVAAAAAARALWQAAAVEERTLTALGDGRTVRKGSLRTIELSPPACSSWRWSRTFPAER